MICARNARGKLQYGVDKRQLRPGHPVCMENLVKFPLDEQTMCRCTISHFGRRDSSSVAAPLVGRFVRLTLNAGVTPASFIEG